jgi:dynein light chain roadblock-type
MAQSEVEETLKRLQNHPGVKGVLIVNHDGIPIRTTLEQATTVQYAGLITQLCSKARSAVRELDPHVSSLIFVFPDIRLQQSKEHNLFC